MIVTLIGLWLTLLAAGDTPIGRGMNRIAVEGPARWLGRFTRGHAITFLLCVLFLGTVALLLEEEGLRLAAMYAPELIGLLASMEFTAAIDALAVAIATASTLRIVVVRDWVRTRLGKGMRARRTRRVRRAAPPSNDDEPGALPLAA